MFAYITKKKEIFCISQSKIESDHVKWMKAIEFDDSIKNPVFLEWEIISSWEDYETKKERILSLLVSEEDYASIDSEWVFLEYSDIWPMIIARFFKGDPNAEMAYLQKWNFLTSLPERTEEQQAELDLIKKWYVAKEEFKDFLLTIINK